MQIKDYLHWLLGDGFILDEALVVGPYPSPGFFEQLRDSDTNSKYGYPRSRLTVLADDGWDQGSLDKISEIYKKRKGNKADVVIRRVTPKTPQGLVHAKLYLFKLSSLAGTYSRRILLVGSANASYQGFGVHAETYVSVDLADIDGTQKRDVAEYLQALEKGQDVASIRFPVGSKKDSWVWLPAINSVSGHNQSGFDAWLRRGRLCHKYQRDQSFGQLTLRLKRVLPKSELEKELNNLGFGTVSDSQAFSRPYVIYSSESEVEPRVVWRKRYFVETYFGYWVSAECYDSKKGEFTESRTDERGKALSIITKATHHEWSEWLNEFEEAIKNMANDLARPTDSDDDFMLGDFFEVDGDDHVNVAAYRCKAEKKLGYDQSHTNDPIFAERFKSGYSFPRMPQLGEDFEDFALDFCQSLLARIHSRSVSNRLAKMLRDQFQDDIPQCAEDLLSRLRSEWESLGANVVGYYKDASELND